MEKGKSSRSQAVERCKDRLHRARCSMMIAQMNNLVPLWWRHFNVYVSEIGTLLEMKGENYGRSRDKE